MNKKLNEIKNEFKDTHASRMGELNKAIERLKKTQKSESSETKNSQKIKAMADLLASL